MSANIRFLPVAAAEYRDAIDYYNAEVVGLGDEFREEVVEAMHQISRFPDAWQKLSPRTRRCQLNRFPCALIYQKRQDGILIVAVMHMKREPNYWTKRVSA